MAIRTGETKQDRSKGKDVRTSNIVAAKAVADSIRTSLGPRGMDKLLTLGDGQVLISNDGATILSKMKVLHPAGKMLVECSQSQDATAGDGTTTVVVLCGALLEACEALLLKGLHPSAISSAFLEASEVACERLRLAARPVELENRDSLLQAVETCLSSKVVASNVDLLAPMAVDSVLAVMDSPTATNVDLHNIRVVTQVGGTVDESELVRGLVLTKGSSKAAGGPTHMKNAKIALIQFCLSAPKTDMDNSVVVSDYAAMDRILREERKYILNQCKALKKAGCTVLLIQKSILRDAYNELSLHFLAKMGILVVTDIERTDVEFICKSLGCTPIAHLDQVDASKFGTAEQVTDVFFEGAGSKVVKFTGIANPGKTVTVLLRGSNDYVLNEAERSLHDAQCVVRSLVRERAVFAGGGAAEVHACVQLEAYSKTLTGKRAYAFQAYAQALMVLPFTLAENAGMRPMETVTELRAQHVADAASGAGIHVKQLGVANMYEDRVIQPLLVSTSAIRLATETVCLMMKIDDLLVVG